ncbi:MAG: thioredoxin-dependent thiol peroxidase [Bacteroidetes bacterium]|nr:thioredoxin-dependent thiol peroxidase [Bacteroidota bacterium]
MSALKVGDKAPDFQVVDQEGQALSLKDFRGSKLILYFYPKDDTPGCTAEACNLKDNYQILKKKGFKVLGVSADSEAAHKKFIAKYVLPFALIPDKEKTILRAYGAWGMKKLYGKEYEGIIRTTYVIDEKGVIARVFTKVDTKNHSQQILEEMGL